MARAKSNIQRLPLEYWMTTMEDGNYTPPLAECSPAFNIDGFYYDSKSKLCWFEYKGKGWVYDPKAFMYASNLNTSDKIAGEPSQTSNNENKLSNNTIEQYLIPAAKFMWVETLKHYTKKRVS